MGCKGLHCDGCHHGGPRFAAGFGALVILGAVLVYAAHRRVIDHAASITADVMLLVLTVAASTSVAAALTVAVVRVHRVITRRRHERQMLAPPRVRVLPTGTAGAQPPAIGQARSRPVWPLAGWAPRTRAQIETRSDRDDRHQ
jgi:hypothetical protein